MRRFLASIGLLLALTAQALAFGLGTPMDANVANPQVASPKGSYGIPPLADDYSAGGYPVAGGLCANFGHQVPCYQHFTTSRSTTGYVSALDGTWVLVPANITRQGQGLGALIEEARTNSIRNNSCQGAVAGTPGTLCTNWVGNTSGSSLTRQIIGTGTESGIDYIDINFSGTASAGSSLTLAQADTATQIAAVQGQTWSSSFFVTLAPGSGSISGLSFTKRIAERNSGGAGIFNNDATFTPVTGVLGSNRELQTATLSNTTTAFVVPQIFFTFTNGLAVNFTLRVGEPQIENNTLINSSVASATVSAGGSLYVGASGTMTWSGAGCSTNPVLNVTTSAGAVNAVTSVATAGSCTTFPGVATTWTAGGGLSAGSGASFNLTPTNNAALGFVTSPIRTTNAAVARSADVTTAPAPVLVFGGAYSAQIEATPAPPTGYTSNQFALNATDAGTTNRFGLIRFSLSGVASSRMFAGGASINPGGNGTWNQATSGKLAATYAPSDQAAVFNGAGLTTNNSALVPSAFTEIDLGNVASASFWNGTIKKTMIHPQTRVPNGFLQNSTNYLLRRDVDPAANDNRPVGLDVAA